MDETNPTEHVVADDEPAEHEDDLEPGESSCRFAHLPSKRGES